MEQFSLNEVIELAIQIEKSGYQYYNAALERKDLSPKARKLIEKLRDEEVRHEETFKRLRSNENFQELGNPIDWQEAASYLRAISDSHIFNQPVSSIKLAASASDEQEIFDFALRFEKDTLIFFHSINQKISDERTGKIVNAIIDEEVSHVTLLREIKKDL